MKLSQQQWANILKVVVIIGWLFLMNSLISCGSSCRGTKRYWRNHRCVEAQNKKAINRARKALDKKIESNERQFAVINNEIIIFENN